MPWTSRSWIAPAPVTATRSRTSSRRTGASCSCTATAHSDRCRTPKTCCRRCWCLRGGALDRFDGRSLRAWLYRIATNRCLNHLRDDSRRPQPASLARAAARLASGPQHCRRPVVARALPRCAARRRRTRSRGPLRRQGVHRACRSSPACSSCPPQQRAVLVLRDVLGFPASEVADILGTTSASVNSALIRARGGFRPDRTPETGDPADVAAGGRRGRPLRRRVPARRPATASSNSSATTPASRCRPSRSSATARSRSPSTCGWRGFWGPEPAARADPGQRSTGVRLLPAGPEHDRRHGERADRPHHRRTTASRR